MDFFQFASYAEYFVTFNIDVNGQVANRLWICLLVGGLCFLIVYIFQAIGLWTIAKRAGYSQKWMAFLPFFNVYYIGVCAQKNKVYGMNAKTFALIPAILEIFLVGGYILYYVAAFTVWDYIDWVPYSYGSGMEILVPGNTALSTLPQSLAWLWWVFANLNDYILSWFELIYILLKLLLLTSFFRTYAAKQYLLFSVVGALLPLTGILIYAVRNNAGMNYMDYLKKVRERNYRMYQQQYGNPYNQNPYNGGYNGQGGYNGANGGYNGGYNGANGNYGNGYGGQGPAQGSSAPDPFDEYGSGSSNSSGYGQASGSGGSSGSDSGSNSGGGSPFDEFN